MAKDYKVNIDVGVTGTSQVDELNESLETTAEDQEQVSEGFGEMGGSVDKMAGGAIASMKGVAASVMGAVRSLGALRVALAATGLGALLLVISSIRAALTSTEEGQNKLTKWMNAISVVTGNLVDLLADLGNKIIWVFENPKEAMSAFVDAFKQNIEVRIQSAIDLFGSLGSAVAKLFKGDFSGALEDAKDAGNSYIDMMTGVEDTTKKVTEAVTDFIDETKAEIAISNQLSDNQAKLDKLVREQLIRRAKLEGEVSEARMKALDEEQYSLEERIGFLDEAMEKNDEIFANEENLARMRLEQYRERNKLAGSTKEDLDNEAQAEADLIRIMKERSDANRRIFSQEQSLIKQDQAQKDAAAKADVAREKKRLKDIADARKKQLDQFAKDVEEHLKLEQDAWNNMFATMDAVGQGWLATLSFGIKQAMDEIAETGKLGAEGIMAVTGASLQAGAQLINMIADQIDTSTRAGFEKQKKLRLAGIVMDTLSAMIAGMLSGLALPAPAGPILGAATAAMAGIFGAVQLSKAKQVTFEGGGGSIGGGSPSVPPVNAAPTFTQIAPASSGESRLQTSINNLNSQPIQAYSVSTEMTSQQALDRRIEANATL